MARAIWTGSLAFGLVNVPVGLYSATEDKTVHFHQFQKGTSSRIRYKRVNQETGEEVDYSDIVKGTDVGGGRYVIVTPEELERVEPGRTRTIDITDFVDVAEIDPIYYQKTYYLAPQDKPAERPYSLLVAAMEEAGRVGIATFVMRSKQYLAAVRPQSDVLTLETMFFADEVRDPREEIEQLPARGDIADRDLDMALSLIDSLTTPWDPENYRDTYRERVEQLIEAKRDDEELVTEEEEAPGGDVVDLMQALQASIERAGGHRPGNRHQRAEQLRRSPTSGGKGGASPREDPEDDLQGMTKAELYELAKELDVPGRSSMTRGDLLPAVRAARSGKGRKAS